jgi:hypothetical protein
MSWEQDIDLGIGMYWAWSDGMGVHWDGVCLGVMKWVEWEGALGWAECGWI